MQKNTMTFNLSYLIYLHFSDYIFVNFFIERITKIRFCKFSAII